MSFGGYSDAEGMGRVFSGISTLFLVSAHEAPDRVDQQRAAIDAAVSAGVERIVYLSVTGAAAGATFTLARDHCCFRPVEAAAPAGLHFRASCVTNGVVFRL
jgi:NAD(P)H dehydrogenase (quinone)